MRHIVALGGGGTPEQVDLIFDYVLGLTGKERPRILFVPTAVGDQSEVIAWFYEMRSKHGQVNLLRTFPWPPEDLRDYVLSHDAIFVSGGNTANMLAIWRVHGIDTVLREAWEAGKVMFGWSAGMICWFEHGVTDSFGPQLEAMECLGWLAGSSCPHYDGEELRRPRYHELIQGGLQPGYACDDGVGLHYSGTDLEQVISCREGAAAYYVTADGEERLEPRLLR